MRNHSNHKISRLFLIKLFMVFVLCVGIFLFSAFFMNQRGAKTIGAISDIYMHNMSDEIALDFTSTVDLRFTQLETYIATADLHQYSHQSLKEYLSENAKNRGFDYLAFCTREGDLVPIYGDPLTPEAPEAFFGSLKENEKWIDTALDSKGNIQVMIGLPSSALAEWNPDYIALAGAFSPDYINETLSSEASNAPVYSHIIRPDGTYPIQNGDSVRENYFDQLYAEIVNGAEDYISDIQAALAETQHYSSVITTHGGRRHLHCTKLAYSDWFLIVIMPYSALDQEIAQLNSDWLFTAICGCIIVILALLWVFCSYLKEIKKKMDELNRVSREAVHANKAKSEFLSNMSHDIRTPMNAIVGMTAIAISNIDNKRQVENCLKKITLSSKHLLGLINDVLDMSKIESGKMTLAIEQISLREIVDNIVNILQPRFHARQQKFDVFIRDITTEDICCDSVRLTQILLNILGNSIKFTPEGGSVQLSIHEEPSPRGDAYVRIHLIVEDNGIGMSPEFQEKIFEAFSRADSKRVQKTEGSGLGMAITKYIVDAMNGTINIQSELGKGSRFHITLDFEKAQVSEVDMVLPNQRMLVVDDDPQLCESTVAALNTLGIKSDWALDAQNALQMIEEQSAKREDYQIILLDWKLPEMDGISLTHSIRRLLGDQIPVLLTSAYDWSEISAEAQDAGVTGFISKPLFRSTLFYGLKPYLLTDTEDVSETASVVKEDFTGKKILLAEDNDLNWEIANELLSELGLKLDWAENGQICLDKFRESEEGYYDAILMDLRMPVMSGLETTREIRALDRPDAQTIPIIAMTADAFAEDIRNCLDCGMNAHVAKPIDIDELIRLLKKHMVRM